MRQEWFWLKMNNGHRQELPAYRRNHSGAQTNPARILPRVGQENPFRLVRTRLLYLPVPEPSWPMCQWFPGNRLYRLVRHTFGVKCRATSHRVNDR